MIGKGCISQVRVGTHLACSLGIEKEESQKNVLIFKDNRKSEIR